MALRVIETPQAPHGTRAYEEHGQECGIVRSGRRCLAQRHRAIRETGALRCVPTKTRSACEDRVGQRAPRMMLAKRRDDTSTRTFCLLRGGIPAPQLLEHLGDVGELGPNLGSLETTGLGVEPHRVTMRR